MIYCPVLNAHWRRLYTGDLTVRRLNFWYLESPRIFTNSKIRPFLNASLKFKYISIQCRLFSDFLLLRWGIFIIAHDTLVSNIYIFEENHTEYILWYIINMIELMEMWLLVCTSALMKRLNKHATFMLFIACFLKPSSTGMQQQFCPIYIWLLLSQKSSNTVSESTQNKTARKREAYIVYVTWKVSRISFSNSEQ